MSLESIERPSFKFANCLEKDPELFFPKPVSELKELGINTKEQRKIEHQKVESAKTLCGFCVHRKECLEWALENSEAGIWGGMSENERILLKRKPRYGRLTLDRIPVVLPLHNKGLRNTDIARITGLHYKAVERALTEAAKRGITA